jgi:hypothetical protein
VEKQNRSWITLIGFFFATTLGWSLVLAAILAGITMVVAGGEAAQASDDQSNASTPVQYSGVITDLHCGAKHTDFNKGASECSRMCVRNGSKYSIVDGDKKYRVAGNLSQFDELAGQRITASGHLEGDTIEVISIAPSLAAANKQ